MWFIKDKECPACHRKWQKDKIWQVIYLIFTIAVLYVAWTCPSALKGMQCCPCSGSGIANLTFNLSAMAG